MLPRHTFQPGERRVAKVSVGWTDIRGAQPSQWGRLDCTDRRLILTAPRVNPLVLVPIWPVFGVIGLMFAGVQGAAVVAVALFLISIALPRRAVLILPLATVARCTLCPSTGWQKLTVRDVVEINVTDGRVWRLGPLGRGQTSAHQIVEALERVRLEVGLSQRSSG